MAAASNGSEFFEFEIETGNESFSRPSNADSVAEDEELLLWAAIARLPSQRRTNFAIVRRTASESDGGQEKAETIDVTKLDRIGRELVVKKALATNEQDNYKLLSGVKKRLDRVGLQLPKVEVRFENLRITANVKTQAYVSGMREALGLYGNELVEFTTYFSIGYAIGLVPGQLIQTKVRPSLFVPCCEITWGLLVLVTCKAQNAQTIYALRFFLGLFSAVFWPSVVALIFNWYTPVELAVRIAAFTVSDVAGSMFLGALQAALYTNMNGVHGLAGWQWLFIIAGAITIGQGIIGFVTIPDTPAYTRALWLTDAEKELARKRMKDSGTSTSELIPASVVRAKLRQLIVHPVTYFYLFAFAFSAWGHRANSYFVLFIENLKDANGNARFSTYQVNVIPLGGYALQILTNLILNWLSDKKHWRWQISIGSAFFYGVMLCVLCGWPSDWKIVMGFYFLTYATNAGSPSFMAWMAELLRKEPEARSIIVAMTVMIVYIGHATIPLRAFRVADSPRYPIGFPLSTAFIFASIAIQFGMLWWGNRNQQLMKYGYDAPKNVSRSLDEESSAVAEDEGFGEDKKTAQTKVIKLEDDKE